MRFDNEDSKSSDNETAHLPQLPLKPPSPQTTGSRSNTAPKSRTSQRQQKKALEEQKRILEVAQLRDNTISRRRAAAEIPDKKRKMPIEPIKKQE